MTDHTYSITEIAGTSMISHADAIDRAVERAGKTLRHLAWVEVKEQRGEIEEGKIKHYQVIIKSASEWNEVDPIYTQDGPAQDRS